MDTARAIAEYYQQHDLNAVVFIEDLDTLPLLHVTVGPNPQRNDLFGLDTLTLTTYALGRTDALELAEAALALADGDPVFVEGRGLIDRFTSIAAPIVTPYSEQIFTAVAEATAEYRL
jgi:hypothetical protein